MDNNNENIISEFWGINTSNEVIEYMGELFTIQEFLFYYMMYSNVIECPCKYLKNDKKKIILTLVPNINVNKIIEVSDHQTSNILDYRILYNLIKNTYHYISAVILFNGKLIVLLTINYKNTNKINEILDYPILNYNYELIKFGNELIYPYTPLDYSIRYKLYLKKFCILSNHNIINTDDYLELLKKYNLLAIQEIEKYIYNSKNILKRQLTSIKKIKYITKKENYNFYVLLSKLNIDFIEDLLYDYSKDQLQISGLYRINLNDDYYIYITTNNLDITSKGVLYNKIVMSFIVHYPDNIINSIQFTLEKKNITIEELKKYINYYSDSDSDY